MVLYYWGGGRHNPWDNEVSISVYSKGARPPWLSDGDGQTWRQAVATATVWQVAAPATWSQCWNSLSLCGIPRASRIKFSTKHYSWDWGNRSPMFTFHAALLHRLNVPQRNAHVCTPTNSVTDSRRTAEHNVTEPNANICTGLKSICTAPTPNLASSALRHRARLRRGTRARNTSTISCSCSTPRGNRISNSRWQLSRLHTCRAIWCVTV